MTTLRQRVLRALQIGALAPGDRLPATRVLAHELDADPRVVADAFRVLASEGLVELRPRAGVYVRADRPSARTPLEPASAWIADLFVAGIARGVPAPQLATMLRRALGTSRHPVLVVATTVDQTMGICRELEAYAGLASSAIVAEQLPAAAPSDASIAAWRATLPRAIRRARLFVTTETHAARVARLAAALGKRSVAITVRPELYETEWALLHGLDAYVVVADPRFGALVETYLGDLGAGGHVHVRVAGRDAVTDIPADAPTYVTQAARERLGRLRLPGGTLPAARTLSDDCLREILREVIDAARRNAADEPGAAPGRR